MYIIILKICEEVTYGKNKNTTRNIQSENFTIAKTQLFRKFARQHNVRRVG